MADENAEIAAWMRAAFAKYRAFLPEGHFWCLKCHGPLYWLHAWFGKQMRYVQVCACATTDQPAPRR